MRNVIPKLAIIACLVMAMIGGVHAKEPYKIGFLIPNPIGAVGWSHELDRGRQAIAAHFGKAVQIIMVSNVEEGPDATRVMDKMVADGVNMLILGSFGYMDHGLVLAASHPNLDVLHIGGYKNAKNFATFLARHYEGSYLCGMAAGFAAKGGELGIIAAFPTPEVINIMNAYVLGAQSVNSGLKPVKVVWLNSWFDPAAEKTATESLASQGSNVIYSLFPGSPSTVATAEQLGVYVTVTDSDNRKFAPKKQLCAEQINFGPALIAKVQEGLDGKFLGDDTFWGEKNGVIVAAGLSADLSSADRAKILARQTEIQNGTFNVFQGPIYSNTGTLIVAAGKALDDKQIKSMNFVAKGINTTLPK
jgi:simple sugar transport system substrate-binding protein